MSLRCVSCGHETPGWELNEPRPTVTVRGDARRHVIAGRSSSVSAKSRSRTRHRPQQSRIEHKRAGSRAPSFVEGTAPGADVHAESLTETPGQLDQRIAAAHHVGDVDVFLSGMQPGAPGPNKTDGMPACPRTAASVQKLAPGNNRLPPNVARAAASS